MIVLFNYLCIAIATSIMGNLHLTHHREGGRGREIRRESKRERERERERESARERVKERGREKEMNK